MWVILAYPPLVVPWSIERPDSCPKCGAEQALYVHERINRSVPNFLEKDRSEEQQIITRYDNVRFRCPICERTFTKKLPGQKSGSLVTKYVQARVVSSYCLGNKPSEILASLENQEITLGRATLYRVLQQATDDDLKSLHKANRRRRQHANRRDATSIPSTGRFVPVVEGEFARQVSAPAMVTSRYAESTVVARWIVDLFKMYRDTTSLATLKWIDNYLQSLGRAGVLVYRNKYELIRDIKDDDGLRSHTTVSIEDILITVDDLQQPLDKKAPPIIAAVKDALRNQVMEAGRLRD